MTVPPSRSDVDFAFPARYTISGVVRDSDGSPLSGGTGFRLRRPYCSAYDVTHVNGTYTLTLISGTYTLQASKSGLVGPPTQTVTVPPNRATWISPSPRATPSAGGAATATARRFPYGTCRPPLATLSVRQ